MLPIKHSRNCLVSKSITVNDFLTEAQEHSKGKVCTKCKEHKSLSEFSKQVDGKNGLRPYCRYCAKEYMETVCPFKKWFASKKGRTKFAGTEFTIEPEDIPGVKIRRFKSRNGHWTWEATQYPKVCPVLGIKLDWGMNGLTNNSPSLDRNPNFGYVKGKVEMMSHLANIMKNNATPEQLKQFSEYHLSHPQLDTNPNQIGLF
jgi:hypothetical protein